MEGYFFDMDGRKIRDTEPIVGWATQLLLGDPTKSWVLGFNHRPLSLSQRWWTRAGD